ncbi:MAG: hypothetical protein ACK6DX_16845 [Acidobacteriota bacterium]
MQAGLAWGSQVKKLRARSSRLRRKLKTAPWKSLVPPRVMTLTTAPPARPNSAV